MTEKMIPESEAQAMVAAALEKAAEHEPKVSFCTSPGFGSTVVVECAKCGQQLTGWKAHILALADQNALAEHDAALREQIAALASSLEWLCSVLLRNRALITDQEWNRLKQELANVKNLRA